MAFRHVIVIDMFEWGTGEEIEEEGTGPLESRHESGHDMFDATAEDFTEMDRTGLVSRNTNFQLVLKTTLECGVSAVSFSVSFMITKSRWFLTP